MYLELRLLEFQPNSFTLKKMEWIKSFYTYLTTTLTTSAAVALSPSSKFTLVGMPLIWAAESRGKCD